MGGVLFIDEAYYLYKPDNERDYGAEAIEILLQVMENQRDDLVIIFAGYKERWMHSTNRIQVYLLELLITLISQITSPEELLTIAKMMLKNNNID